LCFGIVLFSAACLLVLADDAAGDKMRDSITNNKVQIFSKSYCPFCKNTKKIFNEMKVDFHVDELDQMPDGAAIQQELLKLTGQRTVPNVFINGKHLGGNDDTVGAKNSGKLVTMLKEAGVEVGEL